MRVSDYVLREAYRWLGVLQRDSDVGRGVVTWHSRHRPISHSGAVGMASATLATMASIAAMLRVNGKDVGGGVLVLDVAALLELVVLVWASSESEAHFGDYRVFLSSCRE